MKVFIVDNSMMTWAWIANLISGIKGLECIGFTGDVNEAVNTIAQKHPDLVILKYMHSDGAGMNLIKKIKYISPDTRIAVFGEDISTECKRLCLNLGADYFFDKIKNYAKNSQAIIQIILCVITGRIADEHTYREAGILAKGFGSLVDIFLFRDAKLINQKFQS